MIVIKTNTTIKKNCDISKRSLKLFSLYIFSQKLFVLFLYTVTFLICGMVEDTPCTMGIIEISCTLAILVQCKYYNAEYNTVYFCHIYFSVNELHNLVISKFSLTNGCIETWNVDLKVLCDNDDKTEKLLKNLIFLLQSVLYNDEIIV